VGELVKGFSLQGREKIIPSIADSVIANTAVVDFVLDELK
jgi:hypothetical protein